MTKTGAGTFTLGGANTYSGGTTIGGGTLQIGNGGPTGSITGGVTNNATLAYNRSDATFTAANPVSGTGTILNNDFATLTGAISGNESIIQQSAGRLTLSANNSTTGGVTVSSGTLKIANLHALGSLSEVVQVDAGATLDLNGFGFIIGSLVVNGTIANTAGGAPFLTLTSTGQYALQLFGTTTLPVGVTIQLVGAAGGGVKLNADAPLSTLSNVSLDFGGGNREVFVGAGGQWNLADVSITSGGYNLTGGGTLSIQGMAAVTNPAPVTVTSGTLDLAKPAGTTAVAGDVTIAGGTLHLSASNEIADTATITVDSGLFDLAGQAETIGALAGAGGQVSLAGGANLTVAGASTTAAAATITGSGGLTKTGSGTLTLSAQESYTGPTTVTAGILLVDGSLASGNEVTVAAGATLGGSGTVGSATVDGVLAPGDGVGILSAGSVTFGASGIFSVPINGPVAGADYSQLVAAGPIDLGGATLSIPVGFTPAGGATFDVLVNVSGLPIGGTFAGLPEGAVFSAGGQSFTISYLGGSGHDVVLTKNGVPSTTVAAVQINDGGTQRSEVRSIAVTFSTAVTFTGGDANAAAAFQVQHMANGANVDLASVVATDGQGRTVVTLTFAGSETDPTSILNGGIASLADGRYRLTVFGAAVTGANGLALNGGGPNGDYVSPDDTFGGGPGQLGLYRLFGDVTGNGTVDQQDLGQFRSTFNLSSSQAGYIAALDANNDGNIDQLDLGQFRTRFNLNVF